MLTVQWAASAERDMRRVGDVVTQRRIVTAVTRFAETGHGDIKTLKGMPGEYRLRVGHWRVRFTIDAAAQPRIMVVQRVLPRGSAYER